jgi:hypothetical protein
MKKIFQSIFCHKTIDVVDAENGQKQKATYIMLFGATLNIIYKNS